MSRSLPKPYDVGATGRFDPVAGDATPAAQPPPLVSGPIEPPRTGEPFQVPPPPPLTGWKATKAAKEAAERERRAATVVLEENRIAREQEELEEWRLACWEATRPEREAARGELSVLEGEIAALRDKLAALTDRRSALLEAANRFAPV